MSCAFYIQRMALLGNLHCLFLLHSLADMIPEPPYFPQRVSVFLSYTMNFGQFIFSYLNMATEFIVAFHENVD